MLPELVGDVFAETMRRDRIANRCDLFPGLEGFGNRACRDPGFAYAGHGREGVLHDHACGDEKLIDEFPQQAPRLIYTSVGVDGVGRRGPAAVAEPPPRSLNLFVQPIVGLEVLGRAPKRVPPHQVFKIVRHHAGGACRLAGAKEYPGTGPVASRLGCTVRNNLLDRLVNFPGAAGRNMGLRLLWCGLAAGRSQQHIGIDQLAVPRQRDFDRLRIARAVALKDLLLVRPVERARDAPHVRDVLGAVVAASGLAEREGELPRIR